MRASKSERGWVVYNAGSSVPWQLPKEQAALAYSAATASSTIGSKWLASALTSVMPSLAAMARAVVQLSPVTMWQRRPLRLHTRATGRAGGNTLRENRCCRWSTHPYQHA